MDLISIHPVFNLYNYEWPIYTTTGFLPPAKFVHGHGDRVGEALNSSVSSGCVISGAQVNGSVLAPRVKVHSYATIVDSVVLDGVEIGRYATIRRAIIDKYTDVQEHAMIGIDHDHDRARGFHVSENGVVVVPRDSVVTP
jgi:glucose-1-phosphate adenylyltransferase